MVRKPSQFAQAQQSGKIRVYSNNAITQSIKNSLINQQIFVGEDEIEAYLNLNKSNSEEIVQYFKNLYGPNTGINRGQKQTTSSSTQISQPSSSLVVNGDNILFSANNTLRFNQRLDINTIRVLTGEKFKLEMVDKTLDYEDETFITFRQTFKNISKKSDVLDFLNNEGSFTQASGNIIKSKNKDIQIVRQEITDAYKKVPQTATDSGKKTKDGKTIFNYQIAATPKDLIDLQNKLQAILGDISLFFNDTIFDAGQFAMYVKFLDGTMIDFLQQQGLNFVGGIGIDQISKSATTAMELVERINLMLYLLNNRTSGTTGVSVRSTGSQFSDDFSIILDKHLKNNKTQIPTLKIYESALQEYYLKYGKQYTSMTGAIQGIGFWSGSAESKGSDDLAIDITTEFGTKTVYVDAKLGAKDIYSSYIKTIDEKNISIQDLITHGLISTDEIKKQLEIGLSLFIMANLIDKKDKTLDSILRNILIYLFVGSNLFIKKFRKDNFQATLALIQNKYVWMSRLFEIVYNTYFSGEDTSTGRKLSMNPKTIELNSIKNNFSNISSLKDLVKELKENDIISKDMEKIFESFYSISLSLELKSVIKNILSKQ